MGYKQVLISDLSEKELDGVEPTVCLEVVDKRYIRVSRILSNNVNPLQVESFATPDLTNGFTMFTLQEFVDLFGYTIVPKEG